MPENLGLEMPQRGRLAGPDQASAWTFKIFYQRGPMILSN